LFQLYTTGFTQPQASTNPYNFINPEPKMRDKRMLIVTA